MINANVITKFGKMVVKVGLAIGSVYILSKANDELGKLGLNIGFNPNGDIAIHTDKQPEVKEYSMKHVRFDPDSIHERSIAEIYRASCKTYSNDEKLTCAKRIHDIAIAGDTNAKLVAIQALGRISDNTYSNSVKDYASKAIAELATD